MNRSRDQTSGMYIVTRIEPAIFHNKDRLLKLFLITFHCFCISCRQE